MIADPGSRVEKFTQHIINFDVVTDSVRPAALCMVPWMDAWHCSFVRKGDVGAGSSRKI
jgi:hypothetical protein